MEEAGRQGARRNQLLHLAVPIGDQVRRLQLIKHHRGAWVGPKEHGQTTCMVSMAVGHCREVESKGRGGGGSAESSAVGAADGRAARKTASYGGGGGVGGGWSSTDVANQSGAIPAFAADLGTWRCSCDANVSTRMHLHTIAASSWPAGMASLRAASNWVACDCRGLSGRPASIRPQLFELLCFTR